MKNKSGFSLIELIIYIALVGIFVNGFVIFGWDLILSSIKSQVHQEVDYNLLFIDHKISDEIRAAKSIYSLSQTKLCLENSNPNYNPTSLFLSGSDLKIGWGGGDESCMNFANEEILNSNMVKVNSLVFENLSVSRSANIYYSIEMSYLNNGERNERDYKNSIHGSVEIRNN